jgi:hypothetical protein
MTTRNETSFTIDLVIAAAIAVAWVAAGCAPAMDPPSLIESTRVLGARVEVTGDPGRATPKPGESASVTWLMVAPGDMPPLGWAFAFCPGTRTSLDCAGAPIALMQGHDVPAVSVDVPAADALGSTQYLVLEGRVCVDGDPILDGASGRPSCAAGGDGTTASVSIPVDLDAAGSEPNQNPSIAGSPLSLDGQPWVAADGAASCADLPHVAPGSKDHVIDLVTAASDREDYTDLAGDPPAPVQRRERLQISQFTTAGKLSRAYTWIEADDTSDPPVAEVKWDAPEAKDVPAGGEVVRFTFVARDGRGGVDWTSRAACVGE